MSADAFAVRVTKGKKRWCVTASGDVLRCIRKSGRFYKVVSQHEASAIEYAELLTRHLRREIAGHVGEVIRWSATRRGRRRDFAARITPDHQLERVS